MSQGKAVIVFVVFAFAYFLSTLIRAVTATLAPALVQEFSLNARDLGLLAGGYFLGHRFRRSGDSAHVVWCRRWRLPDGSPHRVPALVRASQPDASQFLDADGRRHG
ncbi:MAG: hypothetical protein WCH60_17350 [Burkholderiales bacterium]